MTTFITGIVCLLVGFLAATVFFTVTAAGHSAYERIRSIAARLTTKEPK